MAETSAFFDTNILLYLLSEDHQKADKAEELLAAGGFISVHVLNEFVSVAGRKLAMKWPEIHECLEPLRATLQVTPITIKMHDQAVQIAERYAVSFYDALIVAAAQLSGCTILYSEDLHHGQVFGEAVTVRNPFRN